MFNAGFSLGARVAVFQASGTGEQIWRRLGRGRFEPIQTLSRHRPTIRSRACIKRTSRASLLATWVGEQAVMTSRGHPRAEFQPDR